MATPAAVHVQEIEIVSAHSIAASACRIHALYCRACSHPIIDDAGNPGYLSEACPSGDTLLRVYMARETEMLRILEGK